MLRISAGAENDLMAAAQWYESQRLGLSAEFLDEVDRSLERIEYKPRIYAVVHLNFRRALVRRFPYAVYFYENAAELIVIAVLHNRRDRAVLDERRSE